MCAGEPSPVCWRLPYLQSAGLLDICMHRTMAAGWAPRLQLLEWAGVACTAAHPAAATAAATLCAEFWQRYVLWCEANQPEAAAAVLARAASVHCKRRPDFCVFAARFYEAHGDAAAARQMYQRVLADVAPGLLEVSAVHSGTGAQDSMLSGSALGSSSCSVRAAVVC